MMFRDQDPDLVDAFRAGKKSRFGEDTDPSSRDYAGKPTGITVTDISASKGVMSASFTVPTITVPEGEPFKLIRDNYAFGAFGAVPLGAGSEELMPFVATEGAYDIQAIEGLFMARPNTQNPLQITIYEDAGGQPGKVRAQTTGVLTTKADSYAWAKTSLQAPLRMAGKQKFWVGITYDRDQVAAAYNPDSVSKDARYRRQGKLQQVYNFAKGKEQVPDFIMRVHGYGFIGVNQPTLPAQADESDELIKRMREADALLDKKQFLEAGAQYTTLLQRMAENPVRFITWIPVVINALGVADYQAKNWKGALDMFARSLKFAQMMKDPRAEADILENIGETHFHAGNYDDALAYVSRALDMNTDRADRLLESEYWLGRIYVARGDQKNAHQHLDAALTIVNDLHKAAPEKWRARIARAKAGTAVGEDEESRAAAALSEEHKAESRPEEDDHMSGNKVDLRDFGIGGGN
jgi:tetratricopeptide (TPR) repeat protein